MELKSKNEDKMDCDANRFNRTFMELKLSKINGKELSDEV